MIKKLTILMNLLGIVVWANAQQIPLPKNLEQGYPRIYITQAEKGQLEETIQKEEWAQEVLEGLHNRIDEYVERHVDDPEWMPSRLMMYWKTKATNVYVNGIYYSHADGEAPVPTVRFTGSRDYTTNYAMPDLKDIIPYMDDERGLYLRNKTKEGQPLEWVEQSKTGGIIHRHNQNIIGFARDAAFIYWLEGDERYAKFAFDIFNTYMEGMYYRSEPIDLLNGHIQTLVGFTCFQVIHESTLTDIAVLYDFLHSYIEKKYLEKIDRYEHTMKRWTDQIIKNGVPQNNWNLHQAKIILKAAMVLQDDKFYEDGKGREVFSIKAPPCKSFKDKTGIPYDVGHEPYLTLAARQHGEAWEHPFVSVYEPFTSDEGKSIVSIEGFDDENGAKDFAGIHIKNKSGREDFIFSSYGGKTVNY